MASAPGPATMILPCCLSEQWLLCSLLTRKDNMWLSPHLWVSWFALPSTWNWPLAPSLGLPLSSLRYVWGQPVVPLLQWWGGGAAIILIYRRICVEAFPFSQECLVWTIMTIQGICRCTSLSVTKCGNLVKAQSLWFQWVGNEAQFPAGH